VRNGDSERKKYNLSFFHSYKISERGTFYEINAKNSFGAISEADGEKM